MCNPSVRDSDGKSAVLLAAERGHDEVVRLLLRSQVSHTDFDNRGNGLLHIFARSGNIALCKAVVDIEVRAYRANQSERRWARYLKVPQRRRYLIARNHEGKTAGDIAAELKHREMEALLRKAAVIYAEHAGQEPVRAERIADEEEDLADRLDYDFAVMVPKALSRGYSPQGYYSMVSDSHDDEEYGEAMPSSDD